MVLAFAEEFSLEQLQAKKIAALEDLAAGVVSTSLTMDGASGSGQVLNLPPGQMVATLRRAYQARLDMDAGGDGTKYAHETPMGSLVNFGTRRATT